MRSPVVQLRFARLHAQLPFFIIFCRSSPTMQAPASSTRLLSAIAMPAQQKLSRHDPAKSYLQEPAPRSSDDYDHPLRATSFRSASLQQLSPSKFDESKWYRFLPELLPLRTDLLGRPQRGIARGRIPVQPKVRSRCTSDNNSTSEDDKSHTCIDAEAAWKA